MNSPCIICVATSGSLSARQFGPVGPVTIFGQKAMFAALEAAHHGKPGFHLADAHSTGGKWRGSDLGECVGSRPPVGVEVDLATDGSIGGARHD